MDGRPAPQKASSFVEKKPQRKTGLATLGSLGGGSNPHNEEDDEETEDEDDSNRGDLFAGGEKSGLAVQDPKTQRGDGHKRIIKDIFSKARDDAARPEAASSSSQTQGFRGIGHTLGGDGVPSRSIPDPRGPPPSRADVQRQSEPREFILHIWEDGFSIDEGELRRFDDPANRADLEMIRSGRAPIHLMDVRRDEPVNVKLEQHAEKWKQLPKKYKPFGGEGHRLGSVVPEANSSPPALPTTSAEITAPVVSRTDFSVDLNQPVVNIRVQLPDGSRLPGRFNTTHTVGDICDFIGRSNNSLSSRPWVLSTTFPNKDHTDRSMVLGEMAEFKKGGTAVVKWA